MKITMLLQSYDLCLGVPRSSMVHPSIIHSPCLSISWSSKLESFVIASSNLPSILGHKPELWTLHRYPVAVGILVSWFNARLMSTSFFVCRELRESDFLKAATNVSNLVTCFWMEPQAFGTIACGDVSPSISGKLDLANSLFTSAVSSGIGCSSATSPSWRRAKPHGGKRDKVKGWRGSNDFHCETNCLFEQNQTCPCSNLGPSSGFFNMSQSRAGASMSVALFSSSHSMISWLMCRLVLLSDDRIKELI